MPIPTQYNPIMPYMIVNDGAAFRQFMKTIFSAEEQLIVPREDGTVMHGELRIGPAVVMFSSSTSEHPPATCAICLITDKIDDIHAAAVANGATSLEAPVDKDYGRSAGILDPFGNKWWLMDAL